MSAKKTTKKSAPLTESTVVSRVQKEFGIIGRQNEMRRILTGIAAGRNVLIEGPVGVGKTVLAQAIASVMGRKLIRVDGDSRFTEQKLTGWFDPALVLKKGYSAKTFIAGPLAQAMREGAILFVNELNRMPEAVQNVLLPAIDEKIVQIPQLGTITAAEGFLVVATQNPREFVATSHLSEALMDRMEWVQLHYQSLEEEKQIAAQESEFDIDPWLSMAVGLARLTRNHAKIKRGASVRAAIAILKLLSARAQTSGTNQVTELDFWEAAKSALATRIELVTGELDGTYEDQIEAILKDLMEQLKKNS